MKSLVTFVPALLAAVLGLACGDLDERTRDDDSDSDSDSDSDDAQKHEKPTTGGDTTDEEDDDTLPVQPSEPNEPNEPTEPNEPNECEQAGLAGSACDGEDVVSCVGGRIERTSCDVGDVCLNDGEVRCAPAWLMTFAIENPYFECTNPRETFQLVVSSFDAVALRVDGTHVVGSATFPGASVDGAVFQLPGALESTVTNGVHARDMVMSFDAGDTTCFALAYEVGSGNSAERAFDALYEHCVEDHEPGFYAVVWDLSFGEFGMVAGLETYTDFLVTGDAEETLYEGVYHVDDDGLLTIAFHDGPSFTGEVIDAETNRIFIDQFGDDGRTLSPGFN